MASVASPTSQSHSSRRRGTVNSKDSKESTTEDQALNMIAREAEARLAAKRAARAEARSIRMREIERKQKEAEEDAANSEDSESYDDTYVKRPSMRMSSPTIPQYDYPDTTTTNATTMQLTNDAQVIQLKDTIRDGESKYKKAMVSAAQLDNERQALQYQVEILKDIIEELQQNIENTDDELAHKCREYNKLSREHNNTSAELKKCMSLLEDRERILDENGMNLDGTFKEGYGILTANAQCSVCGGTLSEDAESADDHRERSSLLAEIASLKGELDEARKSSNSEAARRELDSLKTERVELEQSFADVSNEAAVIREDALHAGLYVNNNEKNDDFEILDNGSQQGGIRHFEDQSFEKSMSSTTSSMMMDVTDHRTTSMESSIPYMIDVDTIPSKPARDDYDIVHVGDTSNSMTRSANLNIDNYTNLQYRPSLSSSSGDTTSDININKYLFDDHDDTLNDDNEHYGGTFCVDRYFATEKSNSDQHVALESSNAANNIDSNSNTNVKLLSDPIDDNDLQTSVDTITNMQLDYDTINSEDVLPSPDMHAFCEENRDSPYEDVQVESFASSLTPPSDGMVIIEEKVGSDKFDETSVESSDITLLKHGGVLPVSQCDVTLLEDMSVMQVNADADLTKMSPNEDALVMQTHADIEFIVPFEQLPVFAENSGNLDNAVVYVPLSAHNDLQSLPHLEQTEQIRVTNLDRSSTYDAKSSEPSPTSSQATIPAGIVHDTNENIATKVEGETAVCQSEEYVINILEINTSMGSESSSSMDTAFCTEDEIPLTRIESIAESDKIAIRQNVEDLYNQIAGETDTPLSTGDMDVLESEPSQDITLSKESDQTWGVVLENPEDSLPEAQPPEIMVSDTNPQTISEPHPEPKERKKKKKKKKNDKPEIEHPSTSSNHTPDLAQDNVVPSDPLLLGFSDITETTRKTDSDNSKPSTLTRKSDIPKQFLDASADLIDNSYSDTSDMEDGDEGEDGVKKKSSKRSKKEGCKSQ